MTTQFRSLDMNTYDFMLLDAREQRLAKMRGEFSTPKGSRARDERVRKMYLAGEPVLEIGRLVGLSKSGVKHTVARLGLRRPQ